MNTKRKISVLIASCICILLVGVMPAYAGNKPDSSETEEPTSWTWEGEPIVIRLPNGNEWNTEGVKWPWQKDEEGEESNYDDEENDEENSDNEDENSTEFDLDLSGDEEVPGPGDEDGEGWANVRLHEDHNLVCVDIEVSDIDLPATDAHIHKAAEGVSGPVFLALPIPNEEGDAYGCVKATDSQISEMMSDPELFYVNVHSEEYPDGAVRGQLSYSDEE